MSCTGDCPGALSVSSSSRASPHSRAKWARALGLLNLLSIGAIYDT